MNKIKCNSNKFSKDSRHGIKKSYMEISAIINNNNIFNFFLSGPDLKIIIKKIFSKCSRHGINK